MWLLPYSELSRKHYYKYPVIVIIGLAVLLFGVTGVVRSDPLPINTPTVPYVFPSGYRFDYPMDWRKYLDESVVGRPFFLLPHDDVDWVIEIYDPMKTRYAFRPDTLEGYANTMAYALSASQVYQYVNVQKVKIGAATGMQILTDTSTIIIGPLADDAFGIVETFVWSDIARTSSPDKELHQSAVEILQRLRPINVLCTVNAYADVQSHISPGDYQRVTRLIPGAMYLVIDAELDDDDMLWYQIADETWVSEVEVYASSDCDQLPDPNWNTPTPYGPYVEQYETESGITVQYPENWVSYEGDGLVFITNTSTIDQFSARPGEFMFILSCIPQISAKETSDRMTTRAIGEQIYFNPNDYRLDELSTFDDFEYDLGIQGRDFLVLTYVIPSRIHTTMITIVGDPFDANNGKITTYLDEFTSHFGSQ